MLYDYEFWHKFHKHKAEYKQNKTMNTRLTHFTLVLYTCHIVSHTLHILTHSSHSFTHYTLTHHTSFIHFTIFLHMPHKSYILYIMLHVLCNPYTLFTTMNTTLTHFTRIILHTTLCMVLHILHSFSHWLHNLIHDF